MRTSVVLFILAIIIEIVAVGFAKLLGSFGLDRGVQTAVCAFILCQGIFIVAAKYGNHEGASVSAPPVYK